MRFIANTPLHAGLLAGVQRLDFLGRTGRVSHDGRANTLVPGGPAQPALAGI